MPTQNNVACTLKAMQIVKNPALSLGMSQKDVNKYKRVAAEYGNVTPVIVSAPVKDEYLILAGSARLEAYIQTGIKQIPVVMAKPADDEQQLKLSLMLSVIHDEVGALTEGALISRLINEYGIAPRDLCNLLGKSKAWVSKRMTLDQNLTVTVKEMVTDGTLWPRSAEEIAKLPKEAQAEFAANAINCGLNKTEISQLVACYRNVYSDDIRTEIIKSPLKALSKLGEHVVKRSTEEDTGLNGPGRRLKSCANYAVQMVLKAVNMAENANENVLKDSWSQLNRLQDVAEETDIILGKLLASAVDLQNPDFLPASSVSLGKQKRSDASHPRMNGRVGAKTPDQAAHLKDEEGRA